MWVTICLRWFSFLWLLWCPHTAFGSSYLVKCTLRWFESQGRCWKAQILLLWGPTIGFDLKERSPCLPGTIWSGQSMAEHTMLLPPISFSLPSQPLGHMLLPHCPASARQTKSSHVPCGWSRKCDPKGWALNSSNHDQPMESWSEALIVWSGGISDKSLCKRILNIQILRHLHSNVSYHYICYKWLVVKHTLFPNLALM